MKNRKKMIVLLVQLLALCAFVLFYKNYTDSVIKPIKVYKFARTIPEGTKIEQSDLILAEAAVNTYSDNMILQSNINSIIGKYTTTKVFENTFCYKSHFGTLDESNSMFASLDLSNAVLYSMKVDMTDAAGLLEPGDRIDLMFTANGSASIINLSSESKNESESSDGESSGGESPSITTSFTYSKTFLQDVIIYDVLNSSGYKYVSKEGRYSGDIPSGIEATDVYAADSGNMAYLVLITSKEEAEELKTREATGNITVLKRFEETETHDTLGYIIGNYGKVFSGHANAETSSLQIVSTIQDSDNANGSSGSAGLNSGNSSNKDNNKNNNNNGAALGSSGVN